MNNCWAHFFFSSWQMLGCSFLCIVLPLLICTTLRLDQGTVIFINSLSSFIWTECLCPPKICILNSNPQCDDGFGRWLGHEGGTPMNGISALIKETPESPLTFSTMWGHKEKMATCEPGCTQTRSSPDTVSTSTLVLGFPVSRTARNECVLFKPPNRWYFCYSSPDGLRCPSACFVDVTARRQ